MKGNKKINELIDFLDNEEIVRELYGSLEYKRKIKELFFLIFELVSESVWRIQEEDKTRKCQIGFQKKIFSTYIGNKRVIFVSKRDIKVDLTEVLRLNLNILFCNKTVFNINCTYDLYNIEYVPRNTNQQIRYFNCTLLKMYKLFIRNQKAP